MVRRLVLVSLVVFLGVRPLAAGADEWREQSEKTLDASDLKGIEIENPRGTVTVRRGSSDRMRLVALKVVRSHERQQSQRFARGTQVTTAVEDGRMMVKVHYPHRQAVRLSFWQMFSGFELPRVEVRIDVEVPASFAVILHSTSGDLTTEEIQGPQVLETTSGDVTIHEGGGSVRASSTSGDIKAALAGAALLETVSGDVEVDRVGGALRAATTSGEITIKGAEDSLSLGSVSGDIRVEHAPRGVIARTTSGEIVVHSTGGSVRLNSSSGDVRVGLTAPLRLAEVSTVSGDIGVALHGPMGCSLEMRTTNGTLDLDVPLQVKTVSRRLVTGVVRSGGPTVNLRSSSGDIHLSSGEN